jgi:hypothetical protein
MENKVLEASSINKKRKARTVVGWWKSQHMFMHNLCSFELLLIDLHGKYREYFGQLKLKFPKINNTGILGKSRDRKILLISIFV